MEERESTPKLNTLRGKNMNKQTNNPNYSINTFLQALAVKVNKYD